MTFVVLREVPGCGVDVEPGSPGFGFESVVSGARKTFPVGGVAAILVSRLVFFFSAGNKKGSKFSTLPLFGYSSYSGMSVDFTCRQNQEIMVKNQKIFVLFINNIPFKK